MAEEKSAGLKGMVDKAIDTAGGVMGKAGAALTTSASGFVEAAAVSDMYEIEAGNIALERTRSDEVRAAARTMIDDHRESTRKLNEALKAPGDGETPAPPTELDARRRSMIDHLREAPADSFDSVYLDQQVLAHEEAVTLMHGYRDKGEDERLRRFAAEVSPVIEGHRDRMKSLASAH